jgi:hypothetical protein
MFYLTVGIPGPGSSNQFETFIGRFMLSVGLKTAMFIIGIMAENIVSNDFNGQVINASSVSFLRYNVLNYLNVAESYSTISRVRNLS